MNDTPPDARRAAAALRRDAALDPAQRDRLLALALASAAAATAARGPAPPAPRGALPWATALGLSAALLVAGTAWVRARPAATPAPVAARVAAPTPPPAPVAEAAPPPVAPPPAPAAEAARAAAPVTHAAAPRRAPRAPAAAPAPALVAPAAPVAAPAPVARAATLDEELRVVRAARSANDLGHAADALAAFRGAPSLRLVWAEGAAERVVALCALGRRDEARPLGAEVLRRAPAGASAARVRRSCAGSDGR